MALSMASVAFAANACGEVVGEGLTCEVDLGTATEHLLPGEKYALIQDFEKDYKISGEWKVGGALVASISFDKKAAPEDFDPAHTLEVTAPTDIATTQGEKETGKGGQKNVRFHGHPSLWLIVSQEAAES